MAAAGLKQGDGKIHPDNPVLEDFVDKLVGVREPHEPAQRLSAQDEMTIKILYGAPIPKILSDGKEKHFALGKGPKGLVAQRHFERAWSLVLEIAGDIPVDQFRRSHANDFVERLIKRGSGAETVQRHLSAVRPVISTAIREFELSCNNPFDAITIPNAGEKPRKPRDTYDMHELEAIQKHCRRIDDERRWAILMISDTMTRLAEIVGLTKDEVHLNHSVPHIDLIVTDNRGLKTKQSIRKIPLVGEALWAAQRAISTPGPFLFPVFAPKYPRTTVDANAASAALNKWLKENGLARTGQSLHSFRHTMRDRLRNEDIPADLIDRIGGWKTAGVGEGYGRGHSLEVMQQAMLKTVRPVTD